MTLILASQAAFWKFSIPFPSYCNSSFQNSNELGWLLTGEASGTAHQKTAIQLLPSSKHH